MFQFNINGQPFPFPPFQQPPQPSQPPPIKRYEGANIEEGVFEEVSLKEKEGEHGETILPT